MPTFVIPVHYAQILSTQYISIAKDILPNSSWIMKECLIFKWALRVAMITVTYIVTHIP